MSVSSTWSEDPAGRGLTSDDEGNRTGSRTFDVDLDLSAATEAERAQLERFAELAIPVVRYEPHPSYRAAIARRIALKPVDRDWTKWQVTVDYDSKRFRAAGDGSGGSASPSSASDHTQAADARPPQIKVSTKTVMEPLEFDAVTGDRILNAAGDPFDPPLEVEARHHVFTYKFFRLAANLNWSARSALLDAVSDGAITILGRGYATGRLRVMDVSATGVWEKGTGGSLTFFWEVDVVLEHDPRGWNRDVLNAGKREKIVGPTPIGGGAGPVSTREIRDTTGQVVSDPVPLNAAGRRLLPGEALTYISPKKYVPAAIAAVLA